jgi:hypothetical protein
MKRIFRPLLGALLLLGALSPPAHAVSSFTSCLSFNEPAIGDAPNSWGTIVNGNFTIADNALAGNISINIPAQTGYPTVALTFVQGSPDQSKTGFFTFTGALTANTLVLWPQGHCGFFSITNSSSGAFSTTLGVSNGSGGALGATVVIPQGQTMELYSDGTNIKPNFNAVPSGLTINGTPLGIPSGGTGATTLAGASIVTGPASVVSGDVASFADTTGKVLQDSGVNAAAVWSTGDVKTTLKTTADTGWILVNDGTIGNASSGATTLASATTSSLFSLI